MPTNNSRPHANPTPNPNMRPRVLAEGPSYDSLEKPRRQPPVRRPPPSSVDELRKTKAYKSAARRWVSTIVALPIMMYTSWVLFERTVANKQPRRLPERTATTTSPKGQDAE